MNLSNTTRIGVVIVLFILIALWYLRTPPKMRIETVDVPNDVTDLSDYFEKEKANWEDSVFYVYKLQPRTYKLSTSILFDRGGVEINGEGATLVPIEGGTATKRPAFIFKSSTMGTQISGLTIQEFGAGVHVENGASTSLNSLKIVGSSTWGVKVGGNDNGEPFTPRQSIGKNSHRRGLQLDTVLSALGITPAFADTSIPYGCSSGSSVISSDWAADNFVASTETEAFIRGDFIISGSGNAGLVVSGATNAQICFERNSRVILLGNASTGLHIGNQGVAYLHENAEVYTVGKDNQFRGIKLGENKNDNARIEFVSTVSNAGPLLCTAKHQGEGIALGPRSRLDIKNPNSKLVVANNGQGNSGGGIHIAYPGAGSSNRALLDCDPAASAAQVTWSGNAPDYVSWIEQDLITRANVTHPTPAEKTAFGESCLHQHVTSSSSKCDLLSNCVMQASGTSAILRCL